MWMFPKIGIPIPQNGWLVMENPIKMDDLGVPLFSETPMWFLEWFLIFEVRCLCAWKKKVGNGRKVP